MRMTQRLEQNRPGRLYARAWTQFFSHPVLLVLVFKELFSPFFLFFLLFVSDGRRIVMLHILWTHIYLLKKRLRNDLWVFVPIGHLI